MATLKRKIQEAIHYNFKSITLKKEEYDSLTKDLKNLLKLSNIKVNIE